MVVRSVLPADADRSVLAPSDAVRWIFHQSTLGVGYFYKWQRWVISRTWLRYDGDFAWWIRPSIGRERAGAILLFSLPHPTLTPLTLASPLHLSRLSSYRVAAPPLRRRRHLPSSRVLSRWLGRTFLDDAVDSACSLATSSEEEGRPPPTMRRTSRLRCHPSFSCYILSPSQHSSATPVHAPHSPHPSR